MTKFKTCIYLRLSKEDEKLKESESIINQKNMLIDFIKNKEDLKLELIKIDDGYSGSNFERPAFKEMMEQVKNRKIDCIIVKDFSRFGRDFIEVSRYLEDIFPFMGVRFISVNDGYDSFNIENSTDSIIIPFKNLINDSYLRDISLKIRSSFDVKRKKGDFIGSFATYGYLKDPQNKNKLIVDKVASQVVKDIFKYRLNGYSADKIAKKLNEEGVLCPMEYKKAIGINISTNFKQKEKAMWCAKSVFRILENPIYIGTLVQNKTTTLNYKVKKVVVVPKDEQIAVENNHQPIISKEIFDNVQKLMLMDTRTPPNMQKVYLLSGFVQCGQCGTNLIIKNNGTKEKPYKYYICNKAKLKQGCIGANIKQQYLEDLVFNVIKNFITIFICSDKVIKNIQDLSYSNTEYKKITERINFFNEEIKKYKQFKIKIYEDFKTNFLNQKEYEIFNLTYDKKIEDSKNIIKNLKNKQQDLKNGNDSINIWLNYLKKNKNIKNLNREIVVNLIENIQVYKNKNVIINFKFKK